MSENKNIQNEEELWDLLSEPVTTEPKAKTPKFAKPAPAKKPEPVKAEEPKSEAPKAEPVKTAEPKAEPVKSEKKIDGFFLACMAGVAAVSVAATLLLSGMMGGSTSSGSGNMQQPMGGANAPESGYSEELEQQNEDLKLENAELRAQLEQQKTQIKDLQNDLLTLMGSEEYLSSASTDPTGTNEVQDAQVKALETFAAIQEAYADFDRAKLEELIPQMDEQLSYLTPEMLNNYYLILEYVEQPSNG